MRPWWERVERRGFRSVGAFPIMVGGGAIGAIAIYSFENGLFDDENMGLLDELAANVSFALESMEKERKRHLAVEELDQFFALSLDMLCISNLDGYIHRLNPAWERTLGVSPAEICSRPWMEFVHPEDRPQAEIAALKLRSGIPVDHLEFRVSSKTGCRWLVGSATPAVDRQMAFAVVSDITERKYLDEQLRRQNVALEQQNRRMNEASRLKSECLANMSHELRSPLNGILGFTELLYDGKLGPLPERPRGYLGRIHASASHLLKLIDDVLDLSKVEAGRLEFRPEPIGVSNVIREVTGVLGSLAAEKGLEIETAIEEAVERVTIDAGRLKQILYNYLSNAIKFTAQSGLIRINVKAEGPSEFRLEVTDTGVGISDKDIPRLFVQFQQLDATTSKRHQGTGLGLALTKRVVEAQGGRVGVESTPGVGSTFFAVLPRAPLMDGGGSVNATILAIEDQSLERLLLTRVLREAGYAVEIATTCEEAVEKCSRRRFDAITLDMMLPDGPGWELLAKIRSIEQQRDTPVIVVSGLEANDVQRISLDVQGVLTKPVRSADLLDALERAGLPMRVIKVAK
jgi:PAS domain S-box-containing protein